MKRIASKDALAFCNNSTKRLGSLRQHGNTTSETTSNELYHKQRRKRKEHSIVRECSWCLAIRFSPDLQHEVVVAVDQPPSTIHHPHTYFVLYIHTVNRRDL